MFTEQNNALRKQGIFVYVLVFGAATAMGGGYSSSVKAQNVDNQLPKFSASKLLTGEKLTGPNFHVSEMVTNDGFLNEYRIHVEGRSYRVSGTAVMRQRLVELRALQQMEALSRTDVYKKAVKNAALSPLRTAKNLVTQPVDTLKGMASGVGTFFGGIGHSIFGGASNQEEGVLKTTLGFDAAKRNFAYRFGIDPYTSFPPVKERLDDISWSGVAGGLTVGVAFSAIPGVGGTVVSSTKTGDGMKRLIRDNTPSALKDINEAKLAKMNVHPAVVDIFLEHPHYSPSEKTRLVDALASIAATGRAYFIQRATQVQNETMAIFVRRWAEMMASYNKRIKPIQRIIRVGKAPFAQRADGKLIGLFPIDHLAWTSWVAKRHATNMRSLPGGAGAAGGEIWVEGTISSEARRALMAQNWIVKENAGLALALN